MKVQERILLMERLGRYMAGNDEQWLAAQQKAFNQNNWFIPAFIQLSVNNIVKQFLQPQALQSLVAKYSVPEEETAPKKVGIVLAGNIPLVGFHDVLCCFITGHYAIIKPSSKDDVLISHLV